MFVSRILGFHNKVTYLQVIQPVRTFGFPIRPFFREVEFLVSESDLASDLMDDMFSFLIFISWFG